MGQVVIPNRPLGSDVRAIGAILADFDAITSEFNGNIDSTNIKVGGISKSRLAADAFADLIPAGAIFPHGGIAAPAGYLICDGSVVNRAAYANLFAAIALSTTGNIVNGSNAVTNIPSTAGLGVGMPISGAGIPAGTTIGGITSGSAITLSANATATTNGVAIVIAPNGVGDGVSTFGLPDLRGRTLVGAGAGAGLTSRVAGASGGVESYPLGIGEMPQHNHGGATTTQPNTGTENQSLQHSHTLFGGGGLLPVFDNNSGQDFWLLPGLSGSGGFYIPATTGFHAWGGAGTDNGGPGAHNHQQQPMGIGNQGGGAAHPNMPPWRAHNYIIRHGN